jgi:hypothetical protein
MGKLIQSCPWLAPKFLNGTPMKSFMLFLPNFIPLHSAAYVPVPLLLVSYETLVKIYTSPNMTIIEPSI